MGILTPSTPLSAHSLIHNGIYCSDHDSMRLGFVCRGTLSTSLERNNYPWTRTLTSQTRFNKLRGARIFPSNTGTRHGLGPGPPRNKVACVYMVRDFRTRFTAAMPILQRHISKAQALVILRLITTPSTPYAHGAFLFMMKGTGRYIKRDACRG